MEQAIAKAAGISDPSPDATADKPSADPELGQRSRPTSSRASLPLSRRSSQHSSQGAYRLDTSDAPPVPDLPQEYQQQQEGGEEEGEDEFAWGPSHPCYPHLNSHVPLDSPLYHSTRIIRVKRDWMITGDLAPTFANLYPEVLDPLVSEETFRQVVKKVNDELIAAFSPWGSRAWVDAVMGVATLWLWDDLGLTAVKAKLRALEKWLEAWNKTEGAKEGVKIIPLRRTGYLTVSSSPPDLTERQNANVTS